MENNKDNLVKNDLLKMNLKGEIKKLTEYMFTKSDQLEKNIKGNLVSKEIFCFNKLGNIIKKENHLTSNHYDSDTLYTYEYDDKGNLIEQRFYRLYKSLTVFESRSVYLFDKKGRKTEYQCYTPNKLYNNDDICSSLSKVEHYSYDDKGNMVTVKNKYDQVEKIYNYNEKGNVVAEMSRTFDKDYYPFIYKEKAYNYDDKGNLIDFFEYNSDGGLLRKRVYKYDDDGVLIEHETYIGNGKPIYSLGRTTHKYDNKKNEIEKSQLMGKDIYNKIYMYDYDKIGNWIRKAEYVIGNNCPQYSTEREILYY